MMILGFEEIDSNFHYYDYEAKMFSSAGESIDTENNKELLEQLKEKMVVKAPLRKKGCCKGDKKE